ncbi:hypothetical protein FIU89_03130 [Roseovarius sp. THAF27]|uniref:hypothetical protein n=1 Tax=Roseovarius sp. THAF27 TaxID=2587850 RepID=UPI001267A14B|nr:hypothetical protein [Roseovarius sp. THAF27]QFT79591.1 hypothetical protein FIU89_03130 [Roseovarius sp. THAF27]
MSYLEAGRKVGSSTIDMQATMRGLVAGERLQRFKLEAVTEMALRVAGIVMTMSSIAMWFFLPVDPTTGRLASFGLMASVLAAAGLGVFAFGTRGFRRRITLDVEAGTLTLTKINIHEQARVNHEIDLGMIESVFLRRSIQPCGIATLLVRVAGQDAPAIALSGDLSEVEDVHAQLCAVLQRGSVRPERAATLRLAGARTSARALAG